MKKNEAEVESSSPPSMSTSGLYDALTWEGFRPEIDQDGDVKFKWEGRLYFLRLDEDDQSFIRVCAINIAPALNHIELAHRCCNEVNANIKIAKAFTIDKGGRPVVWVNAECRYKSTEAFRQQLLNLLGGVRAGVNYFHETLEGERSVLTLEMPAPVVLN